MRTAAGRCCRIGPGRDSLIAMFTDDTIIIA
jgi:hypothetical protein